MSQVITNPSSDVCTVLTNTVPGRALHSSRRRRIGPIFCCWSTLTPVPVHPLTSPYTAHLLCARHIWPAGSDSACSKMPTSSSPNQTWSCRPDTGATHLPPYLFRSTNILRSQSPSGLRPHQEWKNYSSRSRDPWRGRGPCRSTYLVCWPCDRERPAKVLEAVSWRP